MYQLRLFLQLEWEDNINLEQRLNALICKPSYKLSHCDVDQNFCVESDGLFSIEAYVYTHCDVMYVLLQLSNANFMYENIK